MARVATSAAVPDWSVGAMAGAVEVRLGNRDRGDAAEVTDPLSRGPVEQGDAVPQHVAGRGADQQRALPDPERRGDAEADQVGFLLAHLVGVVLRELGHGGPLLAVPADVLPLVGADRAARRRLHGVGVLHAARGADPGRHRLLPSSTLRVPLYAPARQIEPGPRAC